MPFIERTDTAFNKDANGKITSVKSKGTGAITCIWSNKQYTGQEEISDTHADMIVFKNKGKLSEIRAKRDGLLSRSDFTQIPDSPLTSVKKAEWATYRQALRDLPAQITDANIDAPPWPTKPAP